MNSLEKKSFYSFLGLYLSSSLLFLSLGGFWYYKAQKNALQSNVYYKLRHYSDIVGARIIDAQMHQTSLQLPILESGYSYSLIKKSENKVFQKNFFNEGETTVLISTSPQEHLGIEYVKVSTNEYVKRIEALQKEVFIIVSVIFVLIAFISYILARLFMRPIHQKVVQIERFIQDISHELNTPVTALGMGAKRALQKGVYDEKILKNISISTKQLYTIYKSLAYLNFQTQPEVKEINVRALLEEVVSYYDELCLAKNIKVDARLNDATLHIDTEHARLLFSNLLSNAVKYSMPNSTITLILEKNSFIIEDEGVGIAKEQLEKIFDLYERASSLAGGFGVGLNVVKQICDDAGIDIMVESKEQSGTRFTLYWS